jgi:hypothetical protein
MIDSSAVIIALIPVCALAIIARVERWARDNKDRVVALEKEQDQTNLRLTVIMRELGIKDPSGD